MFSCTINMQMRRRASLRNMRVAWTLCLLTPSECESAVFSWHFNRSPIRLRLVAGMSPVTYNKDNQLKGHSRYALSISRPIDSQTKGIIVDYKFHPPCISCMLIDHLMSSMFLPQFWVRGRELLNHETLSIFVLILPALNTAVSFLYSQTHLRCIFSILLRTLSWD